MNIESKVITIRPNQIKRAVMLCIKAQEFMPEGKRFGAMVWGQSGLSKNHQTDGLADLFTEITEERWGLLDLNLAGLMPEDIIGLPHIVTQKGVECAKYLPLVRPSTAKFGICRIDEMDRPTSMATLISAVKFAIDGTSENPLPPSWFVLGLGNGISDSHTVELTEHIVGRFCHIYVSMNTEAAHIDYGNYLQSTDCDATTIQMLSMNRMETRDEFEEHAVYNPRTLQFGDCIVRAWRVAKENGVDLTDVLLPCLAGVIGRTKACEWVRILELAALPTLKQVVSAPTKSVIPDDLSLRHKYLTALVAECADDCVKAEKLVAYIVRYPAEVARYALDNLILACPKAASCPAYVQWMARIQ